ncbi:MAG: TetR/AcrR family transcriptional regulator [Sphingobium sp.]
MSQLAPAPEHLDEPPRLRGRPRKFDIGEAVAMAGNLFRSRGYDRVTLNDMTSAIGINPPSFYAAFGSKALLFKRIADSYLSDWLVDIRAAFDQAPALEDALQRIVVDAARRFAWRDSDGGAWGGCLLLEAANNCSDALVVAHIRKARLTVAASLYRGISRDAAEQVVALTDHVMLLLVGVSAMARDGVAEERLVPLAAHAAQALSVQMSAR